MPGPGRSDADKLARMGRILLLLGEHRSGLDSQQLLEQVGYDSTQPASRMRALNRDLETLRELGWRIETRPTTNTPALRVLRTVDNRFAVMFSPAEREQLARAAACAGRTVADALAGELGRAEPGSVPLVLDAPQDMGRLACCQSAAAARCVLRFRYSGQPRLTHPLAVLMQPQGWYLRALDTGDGVVKTFALDRMSDLVRGAPGTARGAGRARSPLAGAQFDPLSLPSGEPLRVVVDTEPDNLPEVLAALSVGDHEQSDSPVTGRVRLDIGVRNLEAVLSRVIELGRRVWLVGPPQVRVELAARLRAGGGLP